jgi:hypothetical protein
MKIKVNEIKSVHTNSYNPLVVTVTHTDGSCQQSNIRQLNQSYTDGAYKKIMMLADERAKRETQEIITKIQKSKELHTWEDTVDDAKETAKEWSMDGSTVYIIANDHTDMVEVFNEIARDNSMPNMDFLIATYENGEQI